MTLPQQQSPSGTPPDPHPNREGVLPTSARTPIAQRTPLYLVLLLVLPLLAVPAAIAFGRSDLFLRFGASVWVRADDAIFTAQNRTCDILIFGDSTAMTGIDPALLTSITGHPACNIAVTNAVLAVAGTLPLDRFLAHNSRPRALVIQLSPESFATRKRSWESTAYPEGLLELLRWSDPHTARKALLTHPQEALGFAGYTAGYTAFAVFKRTWERLSKTQSAEDRIVIHNGFFTPPGRALTACSVSEIPPPQPGDRIAAQTLIDDLRARYAGRADHLLIDTAPIPGCDPNRPALEHELGTVTGDLATYPINLFNDERHYTAAGSRQLTQDLATRLALLEAKSH